MEGPADIRQLLQPSDRPGRGDDQVAQGAFTSGQPRVFRPQSGLTHSRSAGTAVERLAQRRRRSRRAAARAASGCRRRPARRRWPKPAAARSSSDLHVRAGRLDASDVGVEVVDRADDLAELRVAHVRVDLGVVRDAGGGQPERADRPVQVGRPGPRRAAAAVSRSAGSSTWMTAMPAASRSATSSRRPARPGGRSRPAAGRRGRTTRPAS